jgi:hypothetical protein
MIIIFIIYFRSSLINFLYYYIVYVLIFIINLINFNVNLIKFLIIIENFNIFHHLYLIIGLHLIIYLA